MYMAVDAKLESKDTGLFVLNDNVKIREVWKWTRPGFCTNTNISSNSNNLKEIFYFIFHKKKQKKTWFTYPQAILGV